MKKVKFIIFSCLALIIFGLASCKKDETILAQPQVKETDYATYEWTSIAGATSYVLSLDDVEKELGLLSANPFTNKISYMVDVDSLAVGPHSLKFKALSDSVSSEWSRTFNLVVSPKVDNLELSYDGANFNILATNDWVELVFTSEGGNRVTSAKINVAEYSKISLAEIPFILGDYIVSYREALTLGEKYEVTAKYLVAEKEVISNMIIVDLSNIIEDVKVEASLKEDSVNFKFSENLTNAEVTLNMANHLFNFRNVNGAEYSLSVNALIAHSSLNMLEVEEREDLLNKIYSGNSIPLKLRVNRADGLLNASAYSNSVDLATNELFKESLHSFYGLENTLFDDFVVPELNPNSGKLEIINVLSDVVKIVVKYNSTEVALEDVNSELYELDDTELYVDRLSYQLPKNTLSDEVIIEASVNYDGIIYVQKEILEYEYLDDISLDYTSSGITWINGHVLGYKYQVEILNENNEVVETINNLEKESLLFADIKTPLSKFKIRVSLIGKDDTKVAETPLLTRVANDLKLSFVSDVDGIEISANRNNNTDIETEFYAVVYNEAGQPQGTKIDALNESIVMTRMPAGNYTLEYYCRGLGDLYVDSIVKKIKIVLVEDAIIEKVDGSHIIFDSSRLDELYISDGIKEDKLVDSKYYNQETKVLDILALFDLNDASRVRYYAKMNIEDLNTITDGITLYKANESFSSYSYERIETIPQITSENYAEEVYVEADSRYHQYEYEVLNSKEEVILKGILNETDAVKENKTTYKFKIDLSEIDIEGVYLIRVRELSNLYYSSKWAMHNYIFFNEISDFNVIYENEFMIADYNSKSYVKNNLEVNLSKYSFAADYIMPKLLVVVSEITRTTQLDFSDKVYTDITKSDDGEITSIQILFSLNNDVTSNLRIDKQLEYKVIRVDNKYNYLYQKDEVVDYANLELYYDENTNILSALATTAKENEFVYVSNSSIVNNKKYYQIDLGEVYEFKNIYNSETLHQGYIDAKIRYIIVEEGTNVLEYLNSKLTFMDNTLEFVLPEGVAEIISQDIIIKVATKTS